MAGEKEGVRINKFLSEAGICSRREADRLLESGRVTVSGKAAQMGQRIMPEDVVCVDGKVVSREEEEIYLAFYKPKGLVCTTADSENGEKVCNVVDYINYPKRVYPVGRLDQASEGLLLLTNQGEVMEKILRSRYGHEKEYFVKVDRPISDATLSRLSKGIPILDTVTKPCKIWREEEDSFHIVLTQGLNRQIRRMCEYVDYRVVHLCRERVMNITLKGLKKGRYRSLTPSEVRLLKKQLGIL